MKNTPNTAETYLSPSKDTSFGKVDRKTFANLEVKTPADPEVKQNYRWKKCLNMLHDLIQSSGMAEYCLISSFDHQALREMERINQDFISVQTSETSSALSLMSRQSQFTQHPLNIATLYLHNFYHWIACPPLTEMVTQGCGANM